VPQFIISVSMRHMLFIISMLVPSAGIIVHFMPFSVMAQLIWHIMGIMEATGAAPGIIDVMGIEDMDIGICEAVFMVTSWLDNEP
jgi:pseudouridine-5'-phosphate glycosidase